MPNPARSPIGRHSRIRGAQLSLFEERDGWRYQAFVTDTTIGQVAFLEARHRAHARVEDRIRHAEDSGLGRFPSREFDLNQTWLTLVQIAADLTAWTRLLGCLGLRHIIVGHKKDLAKLASWEGTTWGNFMHWTIGRTLAHPTLRVNQSPTRYCYEARFKFEMGSGPDITRKVVVILGNWPAHHDFLASGEHQLLQQTRMGVHLLVGRGRDLMLCSGSGRDQSRWVDERCPGRQPRGLVR